MNRIRVSKKAIADLDDIWVYTADAWSVDQASKYYLQIINAIRNLTNLPDYLVRKYDSVKEGLYGYHVGHHIIFYKKKDDSTIWVDRILHERMDPSKRF